MKRFLVALACVAVAACSKSPTSVSVTTGPTTRYLPTLSLTVNERADITPDPREQLDSLPVRSSSSVVFLEMDPIPLYTPEGQAGVAQVYQFQAKTTGRTVVTLRHTDGTAALQDTIEVGPAVRHGAFAQISTGFDLNTCAVTTDGAGYCWGGQETVQAPADTFEDEATVYHNTPTPVPGGLAFSAISRGGDHTCSVTTDGAAYCWGDNFDGQLGDGSTDSSAVPVLVTGGLTFKSVSAGISHTCGLTTGGAIYCWGNNYSGELGIGTTSNPYNNHNPLHISSDSSFIAVATGYQYSCGVTVGGTAYCWGDDDQGQLGDSSTTSTTVPVPVSGGLRFVSLSAGYFHACGLTSSGDAYCWGRNAEGQLGDGTTQASAIPVSIGTFAQISAGQWATCAIMTGGNAYCWGYNGYGQLGNAKTPLTLAANPLPLSVSGGLSFSAISTGYYHTCGITTRGVAYCWGDNSEGELGDGSTKFHSTPVRVSG